MNTNNEITDLRKHLFNQLDRLSDPNNNLEKEVMRAEAMTNVGKVIVDTAKAEIDFMKVTGQRASNFIPSIPAHNQQNDQKQLGDGAGSKRK